MNQEFEKHRRIGVTVVVAALVIGLLAVSTRTWYADPLLLRTRLGSVSGLRVGADVLISGYSVGHVVGVQPLDLSLRGFEVKVRLDQTYQVPDDSVITPYQNNPLDVVRLNILPGRSATLFKSGDLIPVAVQPPGLLDTVAELGPKAGALLDRLSALADKAAAAVDGLDRTLGDPARPGEATVSAVLAEARGTLAAAGHAAATLDTELRAAELPRTVAAVGAETTSTLRTARAGLEQLQATAKRTDVLLGQLTALTRDNAGDLRHMAQDGEFVLRSLAGDITSLLDNLRHLTATLNDLAQEMRDNPNAVIFGRRPYEDPGKAK